MGYLSALAAPPAPVGFLDSSATEEATLICAPGVRREIMEQSPEQLHKMAINRRCFPFLLPAECSSLLECGPALPEQIPIRHCKAQKRLPGQGGCLEQSKQIQCFWELPLRWSEHWSCGCWHTSSTNREKKVSGLF